MLRSHYHYCLVVLWLAGPSCSLPSPPSLECQALCEDVAEGQLAGDCCSTSYCDCSQDLQEATCAGGQYFCPQYGGCLDFYGQQCDGEMFDCCEEISTTTTTTAVTETTSSLVTTDRLDCSALCETEQPGDLVGHCCSSTFCVCSPAGGHPAACSAGQFFCPRHQSCLPFYGHQCEAQMFDCCSTSTTSTTTTTVTTMVTTDTGSTTAPPAGLCSEMCAGKTGAVGECCGPQYCDCDQSDQFVLCQPQHFFCPSFSSCINMYGSACSASLFDCCL